MSPSRKEANRKIARLAHLCNIREGIHEKSGTAGSLVFRRFRPGWDPGGGSGLKTAAIAFWKCVTAR